MNKIVELKNNEINSVTGGKSDKNKRRSSSNPVWDFVSNNKLATAGIIGAVFVIAWTGGIVALCGGALAYNKFKAKPAAQRT